MMNKKTFSLITILLISSLVSYTQDLKFNGYASYVFNDRFDSRYDASNYYYGKINDGFRWGGGIEYKIGDDYGVELSYQRMNTNVPLYYYYNGQKYTNYKVGENFIMLGSNRYFDINNDKLELYSGAQAGVLIIRYTNPDNGNSGTITKFSWGLKAGSDIWITDQLGIKIQAQLLSAIQSVGADIYIGTGGSGAGVTGNSSILQFGIGGGICYKLSSDKKKK